MKDWARSRKPLNVGQMPTHIVKSSAIPRSRLMIRTPVPWAQNHSGTMKIEKDGSFTTEAARGKVKDPHLLLLSSELISAGVTQTISKNYCRKSSFSERQMKKPNLVQHDITSPQAQNDQFWVTRRGAEMIANRERWNKNETHVFLKDLRADRIHEYWSEQPVKIGALAAYFACVETDGHRLVRRMKELSAKGPVWVA